MNSAAAGVNSYLVDRFASFLRFAILVASALCIVRSASARKNVMTQDPYGPCPCGSGKKFKWCCEPIYVEIDKAFRQDEDGQHDMALRIMSEVVAQHPDNPEAWG